MGMCHQQRFLLMYFRMWSLLKSGNESAVIPSFVLNRRIGNNQIWFVAWFSERHNLSKNLAQKTQLWCLECVKRYDSDFSAVRCSKRCDWSFWDWCFMLNRQESHLLCLIVSVRFSPSHSARIWLLQSEQAFWGLLKWQRRSYCCFWKWRLKLRICSFWVLSKLWWKRLRLISLTDCSRMLLLQARTRSERQTERQATQTSVGFGCEHCGNAKLYHGIGISKL